MKHPDHSLTYQIVNFSIAGMFVVFLIIMVLIACRIGIEVWRNEIKWRRERDAELEAHRVAHHNLVRHLTRK